MEVPVVPAVASPVLLVAHQTQVVLEHKQPVVPAAFQQATAFQALQAVNILVEIHEMNQAAAAAVTSAAAAVEITVAAVEDLATSIHAQ
jgi:hypothetical protein